MTTPRQLQQKTVSKKQISMGSTPANVSIDLVKTGGVQHHQQAARQPLAKNGSISNIAGE